MEEYITCGKCGNRYKVYVGSNPNCCPECLYKCRLKSKEED